MYCLCFFDSVIIPHCRAHTSVPAKDTVFFAPFSNLTGVEEELVKLEALAYIELWIQPGFTALADFLQMEYLPNTRASIAASSLGPGFYEVVTLLGFILQLLLARLVWSSTPAPTSPRSRSTPWVSRRWPGSRRRWCSLSARWGDNIFIWFILSF